MLYIANAFSLQMVPEHLMPQVRFKALPELSPHIYAAAKSIVGHADTAAVLGVEMNRESILLEEGDQLLVAQLVGGRLPEGTKTLPEGFGFKWVLVTI